MGSVAGALEDLGHEIIGSDSGVYPPMSDFLRQKGVQFFEQYAEKNLAGVNPDFVVVGNAISRGNPELEFVLDARLPMISMAEVVRDYLIARHTSVVIAGTHGKTTTASLTSWLLESAGLNPGFLIGGIPENFGFGCRAVGQNNGYFVAEGDEYDTAFFDKRSKFLLYKPFIGVINNIEFDHADIFGSLDDILKSFRQFIRLLPRSGLLLAGNKDGNFD